MIFNEVSRAERRQTSLPELSADNYDKVKHLEFIQNAISRMANNSFMCKGWAITLLAALMVVDGAVIQSMLSIIPILAVLVLGVFWFLDSYYLRLERLFRELYDEVRKKDCPSDPYSMSFSSLSNEAILRVQTTVRIMFSVSEIIYFLLILVVFIVGWEQFKNILCRAVCGG